MALRYETGKKERNSFLVNLQRMDALDDEMIKIGKIEIPMARSHGDFNFLFITFSPQMLLFTPPKR